MNITVYTTGPECKGCNATKRFLDREGVAYAEVDVTDRPADREAIKSLGYIKAPVVVVSTPGKKDIHWSGLQYGRLSDLASARKAAYQPLTNRGVPSWVRGVLVLAVFTAALVGLVLLVYWLVEVVFGVDFGGTAWTIIGGLIGIATIPALARALDL